MERIGPNGGRGGRGGRDGPLDVAVAVARMLSAPVLAWTTKFGTGGKRFLSGAAAVGLSGVGVLGLACGRHPRGDDLLHFWVATTALLVLHRFVGVVRRLGGYACDAAFPGFSWLWLGPGPRAERAARFADAVVAFGVGLCLLRLGSAPLGAVLMVGAAAKLAGEGLNVLAARARA